MALPLGRPVGGPSYEGDGRGTGVLCVVPAPRDNTEMDISCEPAKAVMYPWPAPDSAITAFSPRESLFEPPAHDALGVSSH